MSSGAAGAIAGIGPTGELFLLADAAARGDTRRILAHPEEAPPSPLERPPATYAFPTWLPDGSGVLVSTLEQQTADRPAALLLRCPLDGGPWLTLYSSADATAMLGPRMPHYVHPSPDARHVGLLAPMAPSGLALLFLDAAGRGPAQPIARGSPLFSAWSPQSDALLLHVGGELSLLELATAPATRVFATNHTGYRVPTWMPRGTAFVVSAPDGPHYALQVINREGSRLDALAPSSSTAAFSASPDGSLIALARLVRGESIRYSELQFVRTDGSGVKAARLKECLAFLWSPTGDHLAALIATPRDGWVFWQILDRDGQPVHRFPPFEPSPEYAMYVAFFDQYALSHRLWSMDGTRLLSCGRMQFNGTPPELLASSIYVHNVVTGETVGSLPGTVAFWSPVSG